MKNPIRNVVVEYKNKRARKGNVSLWGNLDLKSIAREVEADAMQTPVHMRADAGLPGPDDNKVALEEPQIVPQIVTKEALKDARGDSAINALEAERVMIKPDPTPKSKITEESVVGQKITTNRRGVKKRMPQNGKTATRLIETTDIIAELSILEHENVSLKRELMAKLRAENENLNAMLERAEQRSILSKG
ncbi:hypothetical protein [Brucella intermedia]|uniref:hypothetical protein n=1 Tax=Brucella intermedia TaxID=94625 RepID=UPI00224B3EFF|nr:hypothetical protein [Brucella intermedia]